MTLFGRGIDFGLSSVLAQTKVCPLIKLNAEVDVIRLRFYFKSNPAGGTLFPVSLSFQSQLLCFLLNRLQRLHQHFAMCRMNSPCELCLNSHARKTQGLQPQVL